MNPHDIIIRPILSEKSYSRIAEKDYTFVVHKSATKTEVKTAVELIFNVKVDRVNVANYDGKVKRQGRSEGRTPAYKKAYVRLSSDSKAIEFFESLS